MLNRITILPHAPSVGFHAALELSRGAFARRKRRDADSCFAEAHAEDPPACSRATKRFHVPSSSSKASLSRPSASHHLRPWAHRPRGGGPHPHEDRWTVQPGSSAPCRTLWLASARSKGLAWAGQYLPPDHDLQRRWASPGASTTAAYLCVGCVSHFHAKPELETAWLAAACLSKTSWTSTNGDLRDDHQPSSPTCGAIRPPPSADGRRSLA